MGFIKHAFILTYYQLLRASMLTDDSEFDTFYHKAVKEVIKLGGDTDTNACIVAGMIGGLVGYNRLD